MTGNHRANPPAPAPDTASSDLWGELRAFTAARIGLPRAGASIATAPLLAFQLAHAQARDAVSEALDVPRLVSDLSPLGLPVLALDSAAATREQYLMQPDLGRRLGSEAETLLGKHARPHDVALVIADGLSARAVQRHAAPVIAALLPLLHPDKLRVAPLVVVRHGRVAIGDAVATVLRADCVVVLIGERPGLSSPDSMGAYLTWHPGPRTTDAQRNCISNIRPEGVGYDSAAFKLAYLLRAMRTRGLSGVALKDDSDALLLEGR